MIYRVVLDDLYDLHTSDINCMLLNPSLELEMNSAGSFNFTLPPTHPYWDSIEILKSTIDVYEDDDLIFTGRVANIDKNWNNERVIECEGALAYFNDSIHRQMKWDTPLPIASEDPEVHNFLKDILDNHNAFVGNAVNRQIHIGHIYVDPYLVTREVNYDKTLDILTRMCIDTNGGYFMIRKDPESHLLYLDWLKDFTEESGQPASFGVNLLDFNTGLHAEDICTGVLARGATVNDQVVTLSNVELVDEDTYPDMSVDHYTDQYQDILWHREGVKKFGQVVQVHDFPDAQTDWKHDGQVVANSLFEEARKWLEEKNTKVESIEVEVAELSWLQEGVPKYKLGQIVEILDDAHMSGESYDVRRLPMYKLSCDLSSGSKKVTLGRPPKKELTQISASNSDSNTLSSGNSSGSSSGGSGSGEECKVHDVRVDGNSVVSNKIANINLTGKADTSTVNALAATVATKADTSVVNALANVVAGKQDQIDFNTAEAATEILTRLKADGKVYNIGGGTEVVANPSEMATDDLETIKIGNTVYDISGGSNYGKFKCDVLFDTPRSSTGWSDPINICTKSVVEEYDVLVLTFGVTQQETATILVADLLSNQNGKYYYLPTTNANGGSFHVSGLRIDSNNLLFCVDANGDYLYKVYGLKFENKLINRSDIYSEEERMIGRWTDGKPLYQKTVIWNNPTLGRVDNLSHGINNVDHIHILWWKAGIITGIDNADSNHWADVWVCSDTGIYYRLGPSWGESIKPLIVTFQYTKTTDSPDSGVIPEDPMFISDPMIFSEEEQVVGSWTDGKPLYQKVITGNFNGSYTGDTTISYDDISVNIDHIIKQEGYARYEYDNTPTSSSWFKADHTVTGNINFLVSDVAGSRALVLQISNPSWAKMYDYYIIVQYTKTTDSILSGPKKGKIVQRSDIYSEEERLVGRWTDGKPLYQKTIIISSVSYNTSWHEVAHNISDIDNIGSIEGIVIDSNGAAYYPGNTYRPSYTLGILIGATKTAIEYMNNWLESASKLIVTLQYTKTTDLPFSKQLIEDPQFVMMSDIYSEDEQVVGRWTDGKPIYQKTWNGLGLTIPQTYWQQTSISMSDMDYWQVISNKNDGTNYDNQYSMLYRKINNLLQVFCPYEIPLDSLTIQYTKTTDTPGTGPTPGNLIYLPALYSEEEREVGVWTDGKPLYQKLIKFNVASSTSWQTHSHGIQNVDHIHVYVANIYLNNYTYTSGGSSDGDIMYAADASNCLVRTSTTIFSGGIAYITVQYTKTTDTAGSGKYLPDGQYAHHYSTSEKVVGTWIDGSTIYERTWDFSSSPIALSNDWTATGITIQNVSKLISSSATRNDTTCCICLNAVIQSGGVIKISKDTSGYTNVDTLTLQYTKSS